MYMASGNISRNRWEFIGNSLPFQVPSEYNEVYIFGQIKVDPASGFRLGTILPAYTGGTLRQETGYYLSPSNYATWSIIIDAATNTISKTDVNICGTSYDYTDAFSYITIMAKK